MSDLRRRENPSDRSGEWAPVVPAAWHGSRILVVGFVGYLISVGFIFSIFGIFIRPVAEAFGAGMATMGLMPLLYHSTSASLSPFLGRRYARSGIRRFMLIGATLLPIGLIAISRASTLVTAALCFAGLAVVGSIMMGPLAANTLVTNWYGPSRGRALGIASAGGTSAGIALPPLAALLIGLLGWRDALAVLAVGGAMISLPTLVAWAFDRPADLGQEPEGAPPRPPGGARRTIPSPGPVGTRDLLRRPAFWAIAATFGLLTSSGVFSILYTVPYAQQLGLSLQEGAAILTARSLAAIAGQVTLGWLSDRIGRRRVLWLAIGTQVICWTLLVRAPSVTAFVLAGIGVGFVGGSFNALRGALVATVFGRETFAKVSGLLVPASLPFQTLVPLAGHLFDRTQDYRVAFGAFLLVFPVAAVLLCFVPDRGGRVEASGGRRADGIIR